MAQKKRHMVEISEALHKVISAKHEATGTRMTDLLDEIVWHWAINHGCRPNEALGVDWSNIDLDNKVLHIRQGTGLNNTSRLKGTRYDDGSTARTTIVPLKNDGSVRDVPLQPSTIELLEKTPIEDRNGLAYTDINGNPMSHDNWNKRHVKPVLKRLGITDKKYTFKSFRKFFCSYTLNVDRIPLPIVSKWMGHSEITTTLEYYDKILEGTGNNYIMSDLYVVETMPVSTAPTGHPNVTPLPLAESLPQYSDDNVIRVTNHEVVFEKVAK